MSAAVVLACSPSELDPLEELAGLPIAVRVALGLKKAGASRILMLARPLDVERLQVKFSSDARLAACVDVEDGETPNAAATLANRFTAPVLVTNLELATDTATYRDALRAEIPAGKQGVTMKMGREALGLALVEPSVLDTLLKGPLDETLARETTEERLATLELAPRWWARLDDEGGKRAAFEALFEACRKSVDGVVARYLNRPISIAISKRLVATSATPNQMSVLTFLLAVAAAILVSRGTYWPMLAGALCFQANSILDGVDGELARVKFEQSKLGEWLDTVSDDLSTLLFYAGLLVASRHLPMSRELGWAGLIAVATLTLTSVQYYVELARKGSGDFYAIGWNEVSTPGLIGAVVGLFRTILKKDFFIFVFLLLAVFDRLPWTLFVATFGHGLAFAAATTRNIARLLRS